MGSIWTGALGDLETEVLSSGSISAEGVLKLRRAIYGDGEIKHDEASFLFHLNHHSQNNDPSWDEFYVEALTDYFVWKRGPDGILGDEDARLLIEQISADQVVEHPTELKLLSNILYRAKSVPQNLRVFALGAIRDSVFSNDPKTLASGRKPAVIDEATVMMIRRVVYGTGSDGGIAIDREEADLLFDLNNRSLKGENHRSWRDLFVKAITMYVLFKGISPNRVDESEAKWLVQRIEQDGEHDETEWALLNYLKNEADYVHSALDELYAKFKL